MTHVFKNDISSLVILHGSRFVQPWLPISQQTVKNGWSQGYL